jgi:hypothetical protein
MLSIKRARGIALTATAAVAALGIATTAASAATVSPASAQFIRINPVVLAGLNPQPLPPRLFTNPLVRVGLNPQPLPPRVFMPYFGA